MPLRNRYQFQAVFDEVLIAKSTQDVASISDGDEAAFDVAVPGAALGDFVLASVILDAQNLVISGNVRTADTVEVTIANNTGGAVDLASAVFNVVVLKPSASLFASA